MGLAIPAQSIDGVDSSLNGAVVAKNDAAIDILELLSREPRILHRVTGGGEGVTRRFTHGVCHLAVEPPPLGIKIPDISREAGAEACLEPFFVQNNSGFPLPEGEGNLFQTVAQ